MKRRCDVGMSNWRACCLCLTMALAGCGQPPSTSDQTKATPQNDELGPPSLSEQDFVGSKACAACHGQIAESYESHPMANSIRAVDGGPAEDRGDTNRIDGKTRFYEVEYDDDGAMLHHEKMVDADGALVFDQAVPMQYVVGSGQRAFAYLHQQGELLFQSPLNWYSQARKWDLSPGYTKDDPRRFRRRITDDCLACHAGRVASRGRSLNRYQNPPFHEMGIGCENCHGPGRAHVALREQGSLAEGVVDPIVNPAGLSHGARESVCNQCHLQATARILRFGRSHFDFRPGEELEKTWTVLDAGVDVSQDGQTRAVNHVQQMRVSLCYTISKGELGCTSCHDPHTTPDAANRDAFYKSRCVVCHQQDDCVETLSAREQQNDSCIACHMPHRLSNNISHITQTDHRVLRRPNAPMQAAPEDASADLRLEFFDKSNERLADWESQRASAAALWLYLDKKGRPAPEALAGLLTPALKAHPNDHVALTILGALSNQHQRADVAIKYFEAARRSPAGEESAVSGLLTLYYLASRWDDALSCANRMIELDPGEARFHSLRADILANLGRLDEGIAAAQRALDLDPTVMPVRQWLVNALKKANRANEYGEALSLLERMRKVIDSPQQADGTLIPPGQPKP